MAGYLPPEFGERPSTHGSVRSAPTLPRVGETKFPATGEFFLSDKPYFVMGQLVK